MCHNIFYPCNVHSYMFWHLCAILREFQRLPYLSKLRKFLQLKQLKFQFRKIIRLKYNKILFGHRRVITIKPVWRYNILYKQCVYVALYTICNEYGNYCVDIYGEYIVIIYIYWTYVTMDLPLVAVVCVLVWRVLRSNGYRPVWPRVVLLRYSLAKVTRRHVVT
jgi:hypothetical protein